MFNGIYQIECDDGKFGQNCSSLCGHCHDKEQCHYINGTCFNGCDDGYQGNDCTQGINTELFTCTCKETGIYRRTCFKRSLVGQLEIKLASEDRWSLIRGFK